MATAREHLKHFSRFMYIYIPYKQFVLCVTTQVTTVRLCLSVIPLRSFEDYCS